MTQPPHIFHITSHQDWRIAREAGEYRAPSLDAEGFIHCSLRRQITGSANAYYAGHDDLLLLVIDPARVKAEIRHEGETDRFPHIYGPLNLDAVVQTVDFPPNPDGSFALPPQIP